MEWTPESHEEICSRIPVGKRFTDEELVGIVDPLAVLDNLRRTTEWAQRECLARETADVENQELRTRLATTEAERDELRSQVAEWRGKATDMLESFAEGCVPVRGEAGKATTPYWLAVNSERARNLAWCELKCKEIGISWPIKPIPYAGNLPAAPLQEPVGKERAQHD